MFIGEPTSARGVAERDFVIRAGARDVPGVLWSADDAADENRPLVLLGHGGSGHKREPYITSLARRLVRHLGFAAAAIDGPAHGDRLKLAGLAPPDRSRGDWWKEHYTDDMIEDWKATIDALQKLDGIGSGPLGYWGLSMGTMIGLPLVAAEPRIQVAVLGLMGGRGRLSEDAPRVACPVLFLVQWDDELIGRQSALDLFGELGSKDKRLHGNPGRHIAVPREEFDASEAFLARHLETTPSAA